MQKTVNRRQHMFRNTPELSRFSVVENSQISSTL